MMKYCYTSFLCILIVFYLPELKAGTDCWEWVDYNGTISSDAIVGGVNADGPIYIGQVTSDTDGKLTAEIFPSEGVAFYITNNGKISQTNTFKILERRNHTSWLATNSEKIHLDLICVGSVDGGYEKNGESMRYTNVGRIGYGNERRVGRIQAYSMEDARLIFTNGDEILDSKVYQVLTCRESTCP